MPYGSNLTDGAGYRTWILLNRIAKDINVNILSLYEDMYKREVGNQTEEDGLGVIPTRCNRRAISSRIDEFQPHVIYVGSWPLSIFVPRTRAISLVDFIGPSLLENTYLGRYPPSVAARLKAEAFSKADLVICANERLRYYLTGFLLSRGIHKPPDWVQVIPMAPPAESPKKGRDFRTIRSNGQLVILVAGSLNPWYDYETIFKAVNEIPDTDFQIIFMGDNPTTVRVDVKRQLIDLARKHGLSDKITITGLVAFKERCNYYLQADIGLNLADDSWEDELSSRARLVDYLWAGLPIITSGRDYVSKLAVESNEASYFAPHNYVRLSQLIKRVISDKPSTVSRLGRRSKVLEILDLDRYVPELIRSLNQLTKVERRPSLLCELSYYAFVLKHFHRRAAASTARPF
jgi:glycosyltransferase involved in cell wall biosynthesis